MPWQKVNIVRYEGVWPTTKRVGGEFFKFPHFATICCVFFINKKKTWLNFKYFKHFEPAYLSSV